MGMAELWTAIQNISFERDGTTGDAILLDARISAQEPTLNPDHMVAALRQLRPELAPDFAEFTRLETWDAEENLYR